MGMEESIFGYMTSNKEMIYFMEILSLASSELSPLLTISFPPFSCPGNSLLQPQNGFEADFAMICPVWGGSKFGWGVLLPGRKLCC